MRTLLSRFYDKIAQDESGCWLWLGAATRGGYGMKWDGERVIPAHRWSYMHFVGPIPDGLHLDHLCRNRGCVNPAHLEPVTNAENSRRGIAGVVNGTRQEAKTECPSGHDYDEANTYYRKDRPGRNCRACRREKRQAARLATA